MSERSSNRYIDLPQGVCIGGHDAVSTQRVIASIGDIAIQTELALEILQMAFSACGATFESIVKLSIYLFQGQYLYCGVYVLHKYFGSPKPMELISA